MTFFSQWVPLLLVGWSWELKIGRDSLSFLMGSFPLLRSLLLLHWHFMEQCPRFKEHHVSQCPRAAVSYPGLNLPVAWASRGLVLMHSGYVDLEGVLPRWAEGTVRTGVRLVTRVSGDMSLQNLAAVAAPKGLATNWTHQRCHVSKSDSHALENTATLSHNHFIRTLLVLLDNYLPRATIISKTVEA